MMTSHSSGQAHVITPGVPSDPALGGSLPVRDSFPGTPATTSGNRSSAADPWVQSFPLAGEKGDAGSSGLSGLLRTLKRRQGIFLFTFAVVTGSLALNTMRERIFSPVFQGGFQMQISNPFEGRGGAQGGGTVEQIARSNFNGDVPSLVVLLRSPLLMKPLAEKQGISMAQLINNLSIDTANEEVQNVLNVSLRWPDAVKGRAILNQLSEDYTRFSLTQRQAALDSGVKFLDRQAPEIMQRVERLQGEMLKFRERNNNLDPARNAQSILAAREDLIQQLRSLQNQQVQLDSRLASVESGKLQWSPSGVPTAVEQLGRSGVLTPGRGAGAEAAAGARTPLQQLNELETDLATARATFREDSPLVQSLVARRNTLVPVVKGQAADEVRAQLLANVAQQDEINRQILLLNQNFRSNPRKMKEYEDLQQRLSIAREHYSSYIQARENFRLELARSTTPWQIIAPADFADVPVEPNIPSNLLRALMLGLLAGVAAAILRERTDHVFHTPMEAEKDLQLPVLGLIPYLPLDPGVEIASSMAKMSASERFAVKESLRSLFTTFRLLRADRNIRLVGVTSSTQAEGKSTAVAVFASTLADLGLKVLIIDADMRLPMQSRYLGVEQGDGLSTLLSDHQVNAVNLIQVIHEHLHVLPSGPKPPDPAKLLNSQRCQEVVDEIRALPDYDIVLWDAPPCLMLSDPILLGEKLDGILFLVGLGKVSRDVAPQAVRRIKASGVDVLGLICNQVNFPSRLNDYGYEYGYYYHYAYAGSYVASGSSGYGKGLQGYVKRQRDSYFGGVAGNYISQRYKNSYAPSRYIRDANTNSGDSASANGEISEGSRKSPGANRSIPRFLKGSMVWLGRRFGRRFGRRRR